MRHSWSKALRPVTVGAAALGLTAGVLGVGAGVASAHAQAKPIESVYKYATYVGGKGKANNKLAPITIGVVNQQTSTNAPAPVWTTGVKVAVNYVNDHTHGIDGHPLKAIYCAIPTTVGAAAKCGQEFANNSAVSAVVVGAVDDGNTALESALKPSKKPTFFGVSLSTVDERDPYGFILYNTSTQVLAPAATFASKVAHAKSVSLVYPSNIPGNVYQAGVVYDGMKFSGIKNVYKVGFTTAETNLTAPFEAAHVGQTTLFYLVNSGGPACSNAYLTLKNLGLLTKTKVLMNVPCDTPTIAKADGGQLPKNWYYLTANPLPGSPTKAVGAAQKVFAEYGKGPLALDAWSADAFGQALTIAKLDTELLKAHKKITPATLFSQARAFHGPVVQGAPKLHCGALKVTPASCNNTDRFFQNTAPTVMKPIGGWIAAPSGFKAPLT